MSERLPKLSAAQWDFLAVFEAFEQPVSVGLAGELAPLAPGPFLDLLRQADDGGWLTRTGADTYRPARDLAAPLRRKLSSINSPDRLSRLIRTIEQNRLQNEISPAALSVLMKKSGHGPQTAELEHACAEEALKDGRLDEAAAHLENALTALAKTPAGRKRTTGSFRPASNFRT